MLNKVISNKAAITEKSPITRSEFYDKLYQRTLYTITNKKHIPYDKIVLTTKNENKKHYAYFIINHETGAGKFAIEILLTPRKVSYKILDHFGEMREEIFYQYKEQEYENYNTIINNWIHFLEEQLDSIDMTKDTYYTSERWEDDSNNKYLKTHESKYEWKDKGNNTGTKGST